MAKPRYFVSVEDHTPAQWANAYPYGAIVNGAQAAVTTVTVHAGHEFAIGDKFIYALDRQTILTTAAYTVANVTGTTLKFTPAITVPDKAFLINIGTDTGAELQADGSFTRPNWDGTTSTAYKDPNGDVEWTNARVDVEPGGEVGWWGAGLKVWVVIRDAGGHPKRLYIQVGAEGGTVSQYTSATEPVASAAWEGLMIYVRDPSGSGVFKFCCQKATDGQYEWIDGATGGW